MSDPLGYGDVVVVPLNEGALVEGTAFGRYRLVSLLGRGGMGEVWRAYDTGTDRVVALKVLPVNFAQDPKFLQRFRREAHAAARLQHPHVVPIHDYGEIDGQLFVDMALIEGRDLDSVVGDGPLEPTRAVAVIEQIARALHAAHRVGLVHRDVKPSNVLLDEEGHAYLIDFGIARSAADTKLTGTGATIGTWAYMAPERFMTDQVDPSCDIYALACVLYESLTGTQPYPGASLERQVAGHLAAPPPRPSMQCPGIPAALDDVIATGMAKEPAQRYSTPKELASAARAALTGPTQQPADERRRFEPAIDRSADSPTVAAATDSPTVATSAGQGRRANRSARKALIVAAAAILIIAATITTVMLTTRTNSTPTAASLPFTGLYRPQGVAVDRNGTVYVTDIFHDRVLTLTNGAAETVLPFTGLDEPTSIAVDNADTRYVTDRLNNRVVALAAGDSTQTVLPFTGLNGPTSIAVDNAGTRYVTDSSNNRVVALAAGDSTQTVLPFTGLKSPEGVAVDDTGAVYVVDPSNNRVVALAAGDSTQTVLPFTGLNGPTSIAVDNAGTRYLTDSSNNRVVALAAGDSTQTVLPFTGLKSPEGVAVDDTGAVYVVDTGNRRVLKLPGS